MVRNLFYCKQSVFEFYTSRFRVLRRTCKEAYKACCRLFTSRVTGELLNRAIGGLYMSTVQPGRSDWDNHFPSRKPTFKLFVFGGVYYCICIQSGKQLFISSTTGMY